MQRTVHHAQYRLIITNSVVCPLVLTTILQTALKTRVHLVPKTVPLVSILNFAKLARMGFFSFLLLTAAFPRALLSIIQVLANAIVVKLLVSNAFHRLNVFPAKDYFSSTLPVFQSVRAQLMVILH